MASNKEQLKFFKINDDYKSKSHSVFVTKNMGVLLHYLLKSVAFDSNGNIFLCPSKEDYAALNSFCLYDVIDCYERLNLVTDLFGEGLCRKSRAYVFDKHKKLMYEKRKLKNDTRDI
jgi:hypothetical protein